MYVEGNNGGDFLDIFHLTGNIVRIKVGHSCVTSPTMDIPVEIITYALSQIALGGWENYVSRMNWPKEFKNELLSQIKKSD